MKNLLILLFIIISSVACKKYEPAQFSADLYISGNLYYDTDSDIISQAVYWKNNQLVMLQNDGRSTYTTDIYVAGNDVYVSGFISYGRTDAPVYWKNGILNLLPMQNPGVIKNGLAQKIMVVNNIVYVAGAEFYSGEYVMKVWQNGIGTNLTTIGNKAFPYDMDISNGNVYVVGYEKQADTAVMNVFNNNWKNNIAQTRVGNSTSVLNGIKVIGTDVYTVGTLDNYSVCRINGTAQTYIRNVIMNDIAVDNNTRFVSGVSQNKAVCWINDSLINLSSPFLTESSADGIAVNGSDVYIAGYEKLAAGEKKARYWLNAQSLALNDSSAIESVANSIYLVKR
ncbi:MAG TPA: hypothetical protein PK431_08545 [Chitinophagales bacterium]|nr:hypothetical protein [Chitinophagales bacterium]